MLAVASGGGKRNLGPEAVVFRARAGLPMVRQHYGSILSRGAVKAAGAAVSKSGPRTKANDTSG